MKLRGNIFIVGRVGPFTIATEEALASIHEKLAKTIAEAPDAESCPVIALRVNDEIVVGNVTWAEIVESTPDTKAISIDVVVDDYVLAAATTNTPDVLEQAKAVSAAVDDEARA